MEIIQLNLYAKRLQSRLVTRGLKFPLEACRKQISLSVGEKEVLDDDLTLIVQRIVEQSMKKNAAIEPHQESKEKDGISLPGAVQQTTSDEPQGCPAVVLEEPQESLPNPEAALVSVEQSLVESGKDKTTQIASAVEDEFGKESLETKQAIIDYVAQDTYANAQELRQALNRLRELKRDMLMQVISEHNQASQKDEKSLKEAITTASQNRKANSDAFFSQLETLIEQMKAEFNLT